MPKAKVLIVEDETIVALDMKKTLEKLNFKVTNMANNCDEVLNSIGDERPDIILMDINLNSDKDGIETAKQVQIKDDIPIIYLTAFSDENTVTRAIETNPVSYLIKPFRKEELNSTIMLGLYKSKKESISQINQNHINLGQNYYYDYDNKKLFFGKELIKLSKKENLLLKLLVDSDGKTVTFEDLESKIWPNTTVSQSTLRTLIYRLRMRTDYKVIESIPMIGCRLVNL